MAKAKKKAPKYPPTPSGRALEAVGDLNGELVEHHKPGASEKALAARRGVPGREEEASLGLDLSGRPGGFGATQGSPRRA